MSQPGDFVEDDFVERFLDRFATQMLAPGSGFASADGRTEEHAQTVNERIWERELTSSNDDADGM